MPKPAFDRTTGWWSIRVKMPDGRRRKFPLAKHEGWPRNRKVPKTPPREVELLARKYQDMAVEIRHGVDVSAARADDLETFLSEYQADYALDHAANSVRILRQSAGHFLRFAKSRGVDTVQKVGIAFCEEYMRARRKQGAARTTVQVEKGCLSPGWTRAVRLGRLGANPWASAKVPGKASTAEPEFWTKDELAQLVAASDGWVHDLIVFAASTGGRISAILKLEWRDVSFERNTVRFSVKTEPYTVPLNPEARRVLETIRKGSTSPRVFPGQNPDRPRQASVAYKAIREAVRKAGIPEKGSYNHILRHTFASHAVMDGHELVTVSKWLGHKSITMTMRYAHLCPGESQRKMQEFSLNLLPPDDPPPSAQPPPG